MARYKDVEGYRKLFDEEYKKTRKLISEGETHLDILAEGFSEASRVIDRMPTADVVPRAEVEKAKREADRLAVELEAEKAHKKVQKELYEKEIRGLVSYVGDLINNICVMTGAEIVPIGDCAKIIKKYTEGRSSRAPTPTGEDEGGVSDG